MVLLSEMEKEQVGKEIKRSALHCTGQASQMVLVVKNLPANAGDIRDVSSIPTCKFLQRHLNIHLRTDFENFKRSIFPE